MFRLLALAAFIGFSLSLAVHAAALLGVDVFATIPYAWVLHAGVFVVFIPFAFHSRRVFGSKPTFAQLRAVLPGWVLVLGGVIAAYAVLNFLLFMLATHGGSPAIRDGKFVLQSHGQLLRELTQAEYTAFRANEARGFSGHWLLFYFAAFAYFAFAAATPRQPTTETPA